MKASKLLYIFFFLFAIAFITGSIFKIENLFLVASVGLVPILLLCYFSRASIFSIPIIVVLLAYYLKDVLLVLHATSVEMIFFSFLLGTGILISLTIKNFRKGKIYTEEWLSFLIMYGFLVFLFLSFAEMVPSVIPQYESWTYFYLLFLVLFLAISFTSYLMKSHYASLWMMLTASSLLFSECCLFFKLLIVEDPSINILYSVFHVLALFAIVQYAIVERPTSQVIVVNKKNA